MTADVLNAIHYLHSIGIIHRDLKVSVQESCNRSLFAVGRTKVLLNAAQPENLLYASNDPDSPDYSTIKVADFGLTNFIAENSMMKMTCGTVRISRPYSFARSLRT